MLSIDTWTIRFSWDSSVHGARGRNRAFPKRPAEIQMCLLDRDSESLNPKVFQRVSVKKRPLHTCIAGTHVCEQNFWNIRLPCMFSPIRIRIGRLTWSKDLLNIRVQLCGPKLNQEHSIKDNYGC